MKLIKINVLILKLCMFLYMNQSLAEGFIAGTLIKIPSGYTKIEDLRIGDSIISNDTISNIVENKIIYITKKIADRFISITIGNENICVASDQQIYKEDVGKWIVVNSLQNGDILSGNSITIEHIDEPVEVYLLSVEKYHNFFVTKSNVSAHNFFSSIILAISASFGLGSAEFAGISFGLAGLGSFLGYKWHKNNESKNTICINPQFYNNGMMPEDPENEKKRKRDEARNDFQPLTNQQAREQAKELGYREIKDHPCGYTHNRPVFTNGKDYISPDKYGHRGGVWKLFDKTGERIATTNIDLTIVVGK